MDIISLASGAGLFDYQLRKAGMTIRLQCECSNPQIEILKRVFPEAQLDYNIFELTKEKLTNEYGINNFADCSIIGGLCCTPFSMVGPAKGSESETWMCDEILRLVDECRPRFILSENVYHFKDHTDGLPYLIPRMKKLGYYGHSLSIPASAFAAPHERQRIFCLFSRDGIKSTNNLTEHFEKIIASIKMKPFITNLYNGKYTQNLGIESIIERKPSKAEISQLRIYGNAVEAQTGLFIGKVVRAIDHYFYETDEGRNLIEAEGATEDNNLAIPFLRLSKPLLEVKMDKQLKSRHKWAKEEVLQCGHVVLQLKRSRSSKDSESKEESWWQTPLAADGEIGVAHLNEALKKVFPQSDIEAICRNPDLAAWLMGVEPELENIIKEETEKYAAK